MNFRDIKYIHEKGNPDLQTAGSCYGCVLSNDEAMSAAPPLYRG